MIRIENEKNPTPAQLKAMGEYHAYATDFGKGKLIHGRDYDQWIELGEHCPDDTVLHAEWPHDPKLDQIKGYVSIRHGEMSRGKPAKETPAVRLSDLGKLEADFRYRVSKNGRVNVLSDTFLYADPKNTRYGPQNPELCIYHWPDQSAIDWAQRVNKESGRQVEKQLGRWTDRFGTDWWVTYFVDSEGKRITRFFPFDEPLLEGTIDHAEILRFCMKSGTMSPDTFYLSTAIGIEPITGITDMVIDRWRPAAG